MTKELQNYLSKNAVSLYDLFVKVQSSSNSGQAGRMLESYIRVTLRKQVSVIDADIEDGVVGVSFSNGLVWLYARGGESIFAQAEAPAPATSGKVAEPELTFEGESTASKFSLNEVAPVEMDVWKTDDNLLTARIEGGKFILKFSENSHYHGSEVSGKVESKTDSGVETTHWRARFDTTKPELDNIELELKLDNEDLTLASLSSLRRGGGGRLSVGGGDLGISFRYKTDYLDYSEGMVRYVDETGVGHHLACKNAYLHVDTTTLSFICENGWVFSVKAIGQGYDKIAVLRGV